MHSNPAEIGERIKAARKAAHLSQTELAQRLDKTMRTVQKYESGEIEPSIAMINAIAKILNISPADLIGYQKPEIQLDSLSDVIAVLYQLNKKAGIRFEIDVQRPPHSEEWSCSLKFKGNDHSAEMNDSLCLILEEFRDEREKLETYWTDQESFDRWIEKELAYYADAKLQDKEVEVLSDLERIQRRNELDRQMLEKMKKAAEEKTADLLAKHDAGAIRIFVKTSRDNARLVYVNQVTKGRESTGELIARLEEKKIRNTELAHEKTVEAVRQIVRDEEIAPTPFTQLEDNILYYIMLGSLRREHLAAVGFPEAYYLTSEQKIAVVNALTDEQRDLITRDFLVKSLTSDIGFDKTGKQLLMEFAALHHKEKYEVVKAQFDEEYTKRNDRLDERIAVAEAQEKAKTKAAKKEGKTGKSTKKTTKKAA